MKQLASGIAFALFTCAAYAQSGAKPEFDVASIRASTPPPNGRLRINFEGGPGTEDPGRFTCENCSLYMLITMAYDIKRYQLSGPDWLDTERFDVTAKIPEGTTKEQFLLMQQHLLADRFKVTLHREKKEMPVYELQIGKNGPRIKESAKVETPKDAATEDNPHAAPSPSVPMRMKRDKDGNPVLNSPGAIMMFGRGGAHMTVREETMEEFVGMLSNQVGRPVTDATGLKGKYDFSLAFAPEGMGPGGGRVMLGGPPPPPPPAGATGQDPSSGGSDAEPSLNIFGAVQAQLGLKLEPKKGSVDTLVIDHAEKTPTEN